MRSGDGSSMKLGLYGGMANNMYMFAKTLALAGVSICFVRDRTDRFAFSQPVWEDVWTTIPYHQVMETAAWDWGRWSDFEADNKWNRPSWVADPFEHMPSASPRRPIGWRGRAYEKIALETWPAIRDLMRDCDALIVGSVEGEILASLSGLPFVIVAHGGDIRAAAGLARIGQPAAFWERYFGTPYEKLLKDAYRHATAVLTHGSQKLGGQLEPNRRPLSDIMPSVKFARAGIPVFPRPPLERADRRRFLNHILSRLGVAAVEAELAIFVPSRVDFYWKGQERLLPMLERYSNGRIHVLFSGWGKDFERLRGAARNLPVTFLPCAFTKQALYDLDQACDLVVDQFTFGDYGTCTQEAMACGTPVMVWIDTEEYKKYGWPEPPVLNCRTADEISSVIGSVLDGSIDLNRLGKASQYWVESVHGTRMVLRDLGAIFGGLRQSDGEIRTSQQGDRSPLLEPYVH